MSLDIQLLKEIRDGVNQGFGLLSERIGSVEKNLTARIDGLSDRVDGVETSLTTRIDGVEKNVTERFDDANERLDHLTEKVDDTIRELRLFRREVRIKFDGIGVYFVKLDKNLDVFRDRMWNLEKRVDRLDGLGGTG